MKGDEFKIILEDINERLDTLIEGQNLLARSLTDILMRTGKNSKRSRKIIFS